MDTMRGNYGALAGNDGYDPADDDDTARQAPPPAIGQDERRMQVRAYNHWAGLLEDRNYPGIEDLEPENLPDFGPYSVLLDFSSGVENPGISYLGDKLAGECGAGDAELHTLADVPPRSLLTRITDHYMQILSNQAPIGFEAEFVNQRGSTIAYRGILLPFSSDDDTIDFIYGVINWKELADAQSSDELLLEIDQALEPRPAALREVDTPLTDWADGPGAIPANDLAGEPADAGADAFPLADYGARGLPDEDADLPVPSFDLDQSEEDEEEEEEDESLYDLDEDEEDDDESAPRTGRGPAFGSLLKMPVSALGGSEKAPIDLGVPVEGPPFNLADYDDMAAMALPETALPEMTVSQMPLRERALPQIGDVETELADEELAETGPSETELSETEAYETETYEAETYEAEAYATEVDETGPSERELVPAATSELDPSEMALGDWLAVAREMAETANNSEDRTRSALYEAIGRAYDFSLAAAHAPAEFDELLADGGLTMQDRAPMTPVVKLVFGAEYDKTRLTEYAAALAHAHRLELPLGALGDYLGTAEGGLKGVVKAERRLRREEAGKAVEPLDAPRRAIAKKLRALPPQDFDSLSAEGSEFALVMIRRTEEGDVIMLGEVPEDLVLVERAARRLLG